MLRTQLSQIYQFQLHVFNHTDVTVIVVRQCNENDVANQHCSNTVALCDSVVTMMDNVVLKAYDPHKPGQYF